MDRIQHPIPPVYDSNSRVLILGSFPSVRSREGKFFYNHPQNRFWKVISTIYGEELPITREEKTKMLLRNRIAVWDVIQSCEIAGSADNSIRNVVPNNIVFLLKQADIQRIYANGGTAYGLYQKHIHKTTERDITKLPSTSPANAAFSLEKLIEEWKCLKEATGQ